MGHDGADYGILQLCLVEVDSDIDFFVPYQLHKSETGSLGKRAVRPPGPGPVQVADIYISEVLATRVVDIHLRVRPLIQGIGPAVPHAELLASPRGLDHIIRRIGPADAGHRCGAAVGTEHQNQPALFQNRVLRNDPTGQSSRGFLRVGACQDKERGSRLLSFKEIDVAVVDGTFDPGEIITQLPHARHAGPEYDGFLQMPAPIEIDS
jgi:hypothetical protein